MCLIVSALFTNRRNDLLQSICEELLEFPVSDGVRSSLPVPVLEPFDKRRIWVEDIEIHEYHMVRGVPLGVDGHLVGVGVHLLDFFLDIRERIGDHNRISKALAHLLLPVDSDETRNIRYERSRERKIRSGFLIDPVDNLSREFDVRNLILSHGHNLSSGQEYVRHLTDRIVDKPHTDGIPGIPLFDFRYLVFESWISDDFAIVGKHIQVEGELRKFWNVALYNEARFFRIKPDRQPIDDNVRNGCPYLLGIIEIVSERLIIRYQKIVPAIRNLFHQNPVLQSSNIMPKMEPSCRAHPGHTGDGFSPEVLFQRFYPVYDMGRFLFFFLNICSRVLYHV